jgi:hypothetical protein
MELVIEIGLGDKVVTELDLRKEVQGLSALGENCLVTHLQP